MVKAYQNNNIKQLLTLLVCSLAMFLGCQSPNAKKHSDTNTSGSITITVDESLQPIIEAQKQVFEALYPNAKLNLVFTNEYDAIKLLSNDSARIAIVTREMLPEELSNFNQRKIVPRNITIGFDAIAIILNPKRTDTIFSKAILADVLNGKISNWNQLNPKNQSAPIQLIFDNAKSGAVRYLKDSLLNNKPLTKNAYAVQSNPKVVDEIEKNENAIGIIGVSWISDKDDSTSIGFLKKIRVANLIPNYPQEAESSTMKPYQAYIALKQYPLYRRIIIINPEGRYGLGTGFASFINSDKGQRIILKSGLVPANTPVRIIQLN